MYTVLLFVTQIFSRRKTLEQVLEPYHVAPLSGSQIEEMRLRRSRGIVATVVPVRHSRLDHKWVEDQLLSCGCKTYRCDSRSGRCVATKAIHSATNGCQIMQSRAV